MAIGVALIGAGIMGADHARILAEDLSGAALRVICDADAARARAVAERYGAQDVATDGAAAIARADVDAVVVASPDATHAPLTLAAIAAGKPVLCEKPLAPTVAEGRPILEAEAAAGRRLVQVGFMRRFDPAYLEMKAKGAGLGRALMLHNFHRNVAAPAWFTGAMAITNSAPHEFDIARFVLGAEIRAVTARQPRRGDDRVAPVVMVMETEAGQIVTVEVNNNAAYGYDVRGELVCEGGAVELGTPVWSRGHADLAATEGYAADWRDRFFEAYRRQNKAFLRFAATGVFPEGAADAWDGLVASAVAEAGVAALASGGRVAVALPARPDVHGEGRG